MAKKTLKYYLGGFALFVIALLVIAIGFYYGLYSLKISGALIAVIVILDFIGLSYCLRCR